MQINMGDNVSIASAQFGKNNTIIINNNVEKQEIMGDHEWRELETFLDMRLPQIANRHDTYELAKDIMKCTKNKDEKGLKGFIQRNKDAFFTNILSDAVSSGLMLILTRLSL